MDEPVKPLRSIVGATLVVALVGLWTNLASVTLRVLAPYGNDAVCRTLYWFV